MDKKEAYTADIEGQELQCELCGKLINEDETIEVSSTEDSTVLCDKCANKFNNLASFYDE